MPTKPDRNGCVRQAAWAQFRCRAGAIVRYALSSANDFADRDPQDWTLQGSPTATPGPPGRPDGPDLQRALPAQGVHVLAARRHPTTGSTSPSNGGADFVQLAELQLANGKHAPPARPTWPPPPATARQRPPRTAPASPAARRSATPARTPPTAARYSYNKIFDVDIAVTPTPSCRTSLPGVLRRRPELPEHLRRRGPGLHRRQLPERAGRRRPARLRAARGAGRGQVAVHQPVEPRSSPPSARSPRARRSTGSWSATTTPPGPARSGLGRRHPLTAAPRRAANARPTDHVADHPRHPRRTAASPVATTSRPPRCRTASTSGPRSPTPVPPAGSTTTTAATTPTTCPRCRRSRSATSPAPGWATGRPSRSCPPARAATPDADRDAARAGVQARQRDRQGALLRRRRSTTASRPRSRPTDHAAMFRFTFPGRDANLIFDNVNNNGGLTLDPAAARSPATPTSAADCRPARRLFVYATFDKPVTGSGMLPGGGGDNVTGYLRSTPAPTTVTMRIATSLISVDQAPQEPRAGDRRGRHAGVGARARAARLGREARGHRGRGRQRGPAHHPLLQPVPAVPLPELGLRERRHARRAAVPLRQPVRAEAGADTPTHTGQARRRQDLRQQRVLGHLPHHLARVRAVHAELAGEDGRRVRPAVPRRRLDLPLVLARLREPDDRHQLRRGLRRRLPQGRAELRRAVGLRRGAEERQRAPRRTRASAARASTRRSSSATPRPPPRGHVLGARGLRQRLRHRRHGEGARRRSRARQRASGSTGRTTSTSPTARRTT